MVTQLMALVLLFFKLISYPRFGLFNKISLYPDEDILRYESLVSNAMFLIGIGNAFACFSLYCVGLSGKMLA
ncbi:hypothetical protein GFH30_08245 [Acinetobacter wanghuae]|uniref:Uncharacterized protein n=1 Tax=Acinetobacter wanghuae TaxID=2662362 RepID=A0ABX6D1A2_9GAMM|nr:hypothetical protein GFH30_08245 [Acinetobacter wanghuae]